MITVKRVHSLPVPAVVGMAMTGSTGVSFCTGTFGVKFPLFSKISVIGDDQHPLYRSLTQAQPQAAGDGPFRARLEGYGIQPNPAPEVLWNFEKFLVSRTGEVVARFSPDTTADDPKLVAAIDAELAKAA